MKENQSSTTAEGIALVRAIEASRPADVRITYDPIARSLVPGFIYVLSKLVIDSGLYARISDGAFEYLIARERYIDDFLKECLNEELDQVVILGAGFDTRAYRIPEMQNVRVFEVDHPASQEVKLKRLKKVVDPLPTIVTFVPVDFNTQTLEDRLQASGYDEQAKTLFIWQGVTMYIAPESVDNTLLFIARHSAPGSAVIFDYFYNEFLLDTSRPEVKRMRRIVQAANEEFLFGLDKGQVEGFLTQRGFCDVRNADADMLKRLYFTGPNAKRTINTFAGIASARVNMKVNIRLLIGQILFLIVVFAALIFFGAGTLNYVAGWAFLILFFAFVIGLTWWLYQYNPALLTERMTGNYKGGQKPRDVILIVAIGILFFAWLFLMPLDAVRYQWSHVPGWLQIIGGVILVASFYLFFATFRENSYLSPAIRVQNERDQKVISTGPYHFVRHPMYAAFVLLALGTPLLLGSWFGLLLSVILVLGVAQRAILEERMLRAELQGYDAYMTQVKYRFIPYVW